MNKKILCGRREETPPGLRHRWLGALLLLLSGGLTAAEPLELHARYDALAAEALTRDLPVPAPRAEGLLPVFLRLAEGVLDDALVVVMQDEAGHTVARFAVDAQGEGGRSDAPQAPRRVGVLPAPEPGLYRFFVLDPRSLDGMPPAQSEPVDVPLDGLERMIDLRLGAGPLAGVRLDAAVWTLGDRAGLGDRLRGLVGEGRRAVRRPMEEPLVNMPDFALASAQCRDANPWAGLTALQAMRPQLTDWPPVFWQRYTHCALRAGMRATAVEGLLAWQQAGGEQTPMMIAALGFARLDLARGDIDRGLEVLQNLQGLLPTGTHEVAFKDLYARTLMSLDRMLPALEVLGSGPHLQISHIYGPEGGSDPQHDFLRLNYGVALMRTGSPAQGRAALDMVGRLGVSSSLSAAIRDRANVTLGWQLLREEQGAEAAAVFARVSLNGPFSGSALLGRGWAPLVDNGRRLARSELPGLTADGMTALPLMALRRTGVIGCHELRQVAQGLAQSLDCPDTNLFERSDFPASAAERVEQAMTYWQALVDRDPRAPETIEGRLALADAHLLRGEVEAAQHRLHRTVQDLDALDARIAGLMQTVAGGYLPTFGSRAPSSVPVSPAQEDDARQWLAPWAASVPVEELLRLRERLVMLAARPGIDGSGLAERMAALDQEVHSALLTDAVSALEATRQRQRDYQVLTLHKLARSREPVYLDALPRAGDPLPRAGDTQPPTPERMP
jgi:hypothetical protein